MKISEKFKGFMIGAILAFIISGSLIVVANQNKNEEISWTIWKETEENIISDSQYNFQVMRDLFTPAYNDSVTVEHFDYINGSWVYWVNHSRILNSYYFDNQISYKIAFPIFGKIYLID